MKLSHFPGASASPLSGLALAFVFLGCSIPTPGHANVTLPDIFSDHMVLQKTAHVPVWGKAASGEAVTVEVAGRSAQAKAGEDGRWQAALDLSETGAGTFQMTVKGQNTLTVNDVLIGEVWLASGQSNMEMPVGATINAAVEIAGSANPMLREFIVTYKASPALVSEASGKWQLAGPSTTGRFSAITYFFGRQLQKELNVPVGIINSSVGGTFNESWMSPEAIAADRDIANLQKADAENAAAFPVALQSYASQIETWKQKNGRTDRSNGNPADFAAPGVSMADWKTVKLPGNFRDQGLPDAGVTWLCREIPIPASVAGHPLRLNMGEVHGFTTVYWNGVKVAETTPGTPPDIEGKFIYTIPASEVKEGKAVLAVRVYSPNGGAGLAAIISGSNFRVICAGGWVVFLAGDWLAKAEYSLPPSDSVVAKSYPSEPAAPIPERNIPGYLYNGMINPLIPYAVRGFIWYQGESNVAFPIQYRHLLPALISDWRGKWQQKDMPFYLCQIASFNPHLPAPSDSYMALTREVQTTATKVVPHTGEAVLIDIGEEKDIHPRNKKDAGERLAKVALANTYGKPVAWSGPSFVSMQIADGKACLQFAHADGGLVARPLPSTYQPRSIEAVTVPLKRNSPESELEGFAICGSDHQWKWADAKIDGSAVTVWSPQVPNPVAVRYGWADNPFVNLYNGAGLPAVPFRTDDFVFATDNVRTR